MVDVATKSVREVALCELLYADDLVLMSETIDGLKNKFMKWMEAFVSKGLKVSLGRTKLMFCSFITKDGTSNGMVDQCGVCMLIVKSN